MSFVLCKGCRRHVKRNERCCPFCGSEVQASNAVKSAASVVLVGVGMAIVACSGSTTEGPDDNGQGGSDGGTSLDAADEGTGQAGAYGPPPPTDADTDAISAAYAPVPPDDAAADVEQDGGMGGVYGPPPPVDAAVDADPDAMSGAYGPPPPVDAGQDAPDEAMSGAYGPPPDGGF